MPSIGIQTNLASSTGSLQTPLMTPPTSPDKTPRVRRVRAISVDTISSPSSSTSSVNSLASEPASPLAPTQISRNVRRRRQPRISVVNPQIHLHLDNINITTAEAPPARPPMVDQQTQAGEPQIPMQNPNSFANRLRRLGRKLRPYVGWIATVACFFLDRVGFGINLTPVIPFVRGR